MGAIAFELTSPFRPVFWTQEPILIASQNDPWAQRKPLVVFPCGAVFENDKWLISLGVNDLKSAWLEMPHNDLVQLLKPVPVVPGLQLLSNPTPTPEYPEIPYEEESEKEGDAECAVIAELLPERTTTGAIPSSPSVSIISEPAPTFEPEAPVKRKRGRPRKLLKSEA